MKSTVETPVPFLKLATPVLNRFGNVELVGKAVDVDVDGASAWVVACAPASWEPRAFLKFLANLTKLLNNGLLSSLFSPFGTGSALDLVEGSGLGLFPFDKLNKWSKMLRSLSLS